MPRRRRHPRGVVDTSVLIAGVAGFRVRSGKPTNPSANFIRRWIERGGFEWLVNEEILQEYREVLTRRGVRRTLAGKIINLLREEATVLECSPAADDLPDPDDAPFWACAESGEADFIVTLNPRDFPQHRLSARIIAPADPLPIARMKRRVPNRASRRPQARRR